MTKNNEFYFRCLAYQEDDGSFTGVCLDLDIIEEGHLSIQEAMLSLEDAINSHMNVAKKQGFPRELVFRPAPAEYWQMVNDFSKPKNTPSFSPFQFFTSEPKTFGMTVYA